MHVGSGSGPGPACGVAAHRAVTSGSEVATRGPVAARENTRHEQLRSLAVQSAERPATRVADVPLLWDLRVLREPR